MIFIKQQLPLFKKQIYILIFIMLLGGGLALILAKGLDLLGYEGQIVNAEILNLDELEIQGDFIIGQTFVAPRDNLQRIDVVLRNYGRKNTHDVTFYLKPSPDSAEVLYQETFNASTVGNNQWRTFEFPPLPDSAGKTFFFYFASPDSIGGDAISVGGATGDFYDEGNAYLILGPAEGDLAFRTHYGLSPAEKLTILGQRIVEDKPSIWGDIRFYILLLILYGLFMIRVFAQLCKLVQSE
ncbi:MAG: hypothetical protein JW953_06660 [Anaerolineae bacterium]|nr:hypothetical protein [Anaerolineae bacterium]